MDALTEAKTLYREASDALSEERERIREDLAFTDPAEPQQWDESERRQRENDPGGKRPCLVFDQLNQYVENIVGAVEQRPPSIAAAAVDGKGDKKVAEKMGGIFRAIEYASRAGQHYAVGQRSAARAGVGYLVLRSTVVDAPLNYQEPRISSVGDPLMAIRDPWATELDGSDANFGYVLTSLSARQFKRKYPGKDLVSFDKDTVSTSDDDSILIVEEWLKVDKTKTVLVLADADGVEYTLDEDEAKKRHEDGESLNVLRQFRDKRAEVMWRTMSGADVFEESEYQACRVGLFPVYGYVGFENGRLKVAGIARKARDQQRAYNYHKSEERALMAQAAKSPYMMPMSALTDDNIKRMWDRASVETRAYLPYEDWDAVNNRPIAPPQRMQSAVDLRNHIMAAQEARDNIRSVLGMYAPSVGEPSGAKSGIAIRSEQAQGETSTAVFPAHLAATVSGLASATADMIPRLIDTKRQIRMAGLDGSSSMVVVDPKIEGAAQETEQGLVINPNVGRYDFRATVGQSFTTQRSQAQEALGEIMARNPALAQLVGPLWAMNLDFLGADKLAQVLIAALPENMRAIYSPEDANKPTAEALMQQVGQLKQALQEAIQHAQEAMQEAHEANAALQTKHAEAEAKEAETHIKAYDAVTKRIQAMGTALTPDQVAAIAYQAAQQAVAVPPMEPEGMPDGMAPMMAEPQEQPEQYEMQPFPAAMNDDPNAATALENQDGYA